MIVNLIRKLLFIIINIIFINNIINIAIAKPDNTNNFNNTNNLDWQAGSCCAPQDNLICGGCYVESAYPLNITNKLPRDTLVITANKTKLITNQLSKFNGNVAITKNNQQLTADQAEIQQNSQAEIKSATVAGNVKFIEPGLRVIGDKAEAFPQQNYKIIYNADYRLYKQHGRGTASKIEIFDNNIMSLPNASYTTCQPNSNTWCLKAKKIVFNKDTGRGEAWHAKMYVKDIPVFYLPYINFPIDNRRQTGFLSPIFGRDSKNGTSFGIPFYWNMAPNYDYTVTPNYMSNRGFKFDNKFRYLTANATGTSTGNLQFNFLPGDSKDNNKFRYATWFSNQTAITKHWKSVIKYNKVSDNNYLYDFGKDIGQINQLISNNNLFGSSLELEETVQNSAVHLEQSAKLENFNKYGFLKFKVLQYQTLYPTNQPSSIEQYKKMPEIAWNANYIYLPANYKIKYNVNYTDFKSHSKTNGKRIYLLPTLEKSLYASYGYIKPRIQLDILSYQDLRNLNNINLTNTKPSRITPVFDLNTGLNFTRTLSSNNLNNIEQTLEPKLYYLYVPKINQTRYPIFDTNATDFGYDQLFRSNRYNGPDRLADAHQITFGVKSSIYKNGEEKVSFKIARARYFHNLTAYLGENVDFGKWSPIGMLINYYLTPKLSLEANIVRQKLNQTRTSTFTGQYKFDEQKIINLGYQYAKFATTPQHQGQTSVIWTVSNNINLLAKLDYDLHQKRLAYSLAGVEIHGCCTIVRFAIARNLLPAENLLKKQYDHKFLAQIIFKGLNNGGFGSFGSNYISNKIPGYMRKEK